MSLRDLLDPSRALQETLSDYRRRLTAVRRRVRYPGAIVRDAVSAVDVDVSYTGHSASPTDLLGITVGQGRWLVSIQITIGLDIDLTAFGNGEVSYLTLVNGETWFPMTNTATDAFAYNAIFPIYATDTFVFEGDDNTFHVEVSASAVGPTPAYADGLVHEAEILAVPY